MRPVRSALVAFGVACAIVPTFAGVASAQVEDYTVDLAVECNTTTGDYDVTTTFTNNLDEQVLDFDDVWVYFERGEDGLENWIEIGELPPVVFGTPYDLVQSIPGDSTFVEVEWDVDELEDGGDVDLDLEGDCVPIPTTTTTAAPTTTTTAAPTTTTAAAAAVAVTPTYAG